MSAVDLQKGSSDTKRTSQTLRSTVISCTFIVCKKKEEKKKRERGYLMLGKRLLFDNGTGRGLSSNGRTCVPFYTSVVSSVFVIEPVQSAVDKINKSSLGTADGARSLIRAVRLSQGRWKACHPWPFLIYPRSPVELSFSGRCRRARSLTGTEAVGRHAVFLCCDGWISWSNQRMTVFRTAHFLFAVKSPGASHTKNMGWLQERGSTKKIWPCGNLSHARRNIEEC